MLHDHRSIHRFSHGTFNIETDRLAVENLVELRTKDMTITRLLATSHDVEWLAVGHLHLEHGLEIPQESLEIERHGNGSISVQVSGIGNRNDLVQRPSIVTSSCGACDHPHLGGELTVERAATQQPGSLSMDTLRYGFEIMRRGQTGFKSTGGMHAALLMAGDQDHVLCEDIGRHNAVDKAWGAWRLSKKGASPKALLLSGRVGWDIVAKAVRMGVNIVASVGAASTMAADTARSHNVTLVSFWKQDSAVVIGHISGLNTQRVENGDHSEQPR